MAFMTPEVNGARQELPCLESPEINGARQEVAVVEKYVDGAWQEVWCSFSLPEMQILSSNLSAVNAGYNAYGAWVLSSFTEGYEETVTYYSEGMFKNPTISLDYWGVAEYQLTGYDPHFMSVGELYVYTRTTDGVEKYTAIDSSIGSQQGDEEGTYNNTFEGTFDCIGLKVVIESFNVANDVDFIDRNIYLSNLYVNDKPWYFSAACEE